MAKQKLSIEYDFDFTLIGICSHDKEYKFCWEMNKCLSLDFIKVKEGLSIESKKGEKMVSTFSLYKYYDEAMFTEYYIIANKSEGKLLIPEQKIVDYFLLIQGNNSEEDSSRIFRQLKNYSGFITAMTIDPNTLKSKHLLVF